jgi:hypothetical protein
MKAVSRLLLGAVMLAGTAVTAAMPAQAQGFSYGFGFGSGGYGPGPGVHFSVGVGPAWTTGRWVHGWHGPRYGWWWTVGNDWYYYPRPVYPYPTYLPPPYYSYGPGYGLGYAPGYGPGYGPEYGAPTRRPYFDPNAGGPDRNPQPPQYWYFCRNPEGYYPYIQDCDDWQQELAQGGPPPGDYPEYQEEDFQREP